MRYFLNLKQGTIGFITILFFFLKKNNDITHCFTKGEKRGYHIYLFLQQFCKLSEKVMQKRKPDIPAKKNPSFTVIFKKMKFDQTFRDK